MAQRHLWLIELFDWVRGSCDSVPASVARVQLLVEALEANPKTRQRLQDWWQALSETVDITPLLADFGFAPRTGLFSELAERLRCKLLPSSPETFDASELFTLALPYAFDAQWLAALPEALLERLVAAFTPEGASGTRWQKTLLDAIT